MSPQVPTIEISLAEKVNLANFQNAIPCLKELRLVNETEQEWGGLELSIESSPPFLKSRTWRVDGLRAHGSCSIQDLDLKLDGPLFSSLGEAEKATAVFVLRSVGESGKELARIEKVVELLPRNQWGGLSQLPDLLAAFVQPNDSAIDRLLKSAAETLRQNGKSGAINGYEGGSKRAWELASAVWTAVAGLELDYTVPPASFETQGQKVRTPGQIFESRLGTCLDLSLLFAAALEQAGLNPLLICTKGHAFVGLWLKSEDFSTPTVDDVTALRKRLKLKELIAFETTLVTERPVPNFSYAVERGESRLAEDKDDEFELAVDVRRARRHRIKPLSHHDATIVAAQIDTLISQEPRFEEAPELPEDDAQSATDPENFAPQDRLSRWQRKLLDLSLRNNLLNFRPSKKSLKLDTPNPGALEDLLADNQHIKLLPRPSLLQGDDARDKTILEARERIEVLKEHALDALTRNEVYIDVGKDDLDSRLLELYRNARTNLQEGGANTLYLAVGFLVWTKTGIDTVKHRAPLILIPVTLERKSVRSGFTVSIHEDEPRFNPTLLEMLRQDFKISLPVTDGELPKDDSGLDISGIWRSIAVGIKDISGWEVSEDVVLSTFSFSKYLMWKDLTERTEQLCKNPVVRHLLETPREHYQTGNSFPDARRLDQDSQPKDVFCPLPADSSQLTAVMAAAKGKDFVLIGPPGTGKSQTITNIISQCLAEGKRVLFVAEKIAALEVVYRRLKAVQLGEFCLEIHSNKAKKIEVIAHLNKSWESKGTQDNQVWLAEADRLYKLRGELNLYVERLHARRANGMSIHEAIGNCVYGVDLPRIEMSWPSAEHHSPADIELLRDLVRRMEVNALAIGLGQASAHPLQAVGQSDWSLRFQNDLSESLAAARESNRTAQDGFIRFLEILELNRIPAGRDNREALICFAKIAAKGAGQNWRYVLREDRGALLNQLHLGDDLLSRHHCINEGLPAGWSPEIIRAVAVGLSLLERRKVLTETLRPWHPESQSIVEKGAKLLDETTTTTRALSVSYSPAADQLNPHQLLANWSKATTQVWPISWFGKRKIRKVLEAAMEGAGLPDPSRDLPGLVTIRNLTKEISLLDPGPATSEVWQGVNSREEAVQSAIAFQHALRAALADCDWNDVGFGPIERGLCGNTLSKQLEQLREWRQIDEKILALSGLQAATKGLWTGKHTDMDSLRAVLDFYRDRGSVPIRGSLQRDHSLLSQGAFGQELANEFQTLKQRSEIELRIDALAHLEQETSGLWKGLDTIPVDLQLGLEIGVAIERLNTVLQSVPEQTAALTRCLLRLFSEGSLAWGPASTFITEIDLFKESMVGLNTLDHLAAVAMFSPAHTAQLLDASLTGMEKFLKGMTDNLSSLRAWCAWKSCWNDAKAAGLGSLAAEIMIGRVRNVDTRKVFESNYSRWWLHAVVDQDDVIRKFVSAEHERRIQDFRELDARFTQLTSNLVRARLCSKIPAPADVGRDAEWGILRREINKKKRHMPLREMMKSIPSAMAKLSPCLLMSPLSIAQYLSPDASNFDVVVFDEASQIPVWDAIGAMARGRQIVMVGDPKQLPPTNFFDRAESDLDDEDVEGDLESILDECMGANLPTLNINWHYRSRSESLIAFSNHRYYGGGLVTFPSPVNPDKAVTLHLVQGVYEKGGARTNKPEAKALVADLVARLKSKEFRTSRKTIGVVTFNSEQQRLIENLLDEERRRDPSIEPYFDDVELEPVFVKNIESVQGDERDIMYFSITYGPDLTGAVSMNFGPMNRDGGERRLNVAITRARYELRIFSTLKPEQMDLSRTQANGVRDLKHFLEFAQRGSQALAETSVPTGLDFDSPFESSVAQALTLRGWRIHTQIGISSFRIDLAVVHPDAPGLYLAGVECDGATYHSSATARDRDKLREEVLRGLGWEILRIWSTDWWIDRNGTLEAIHRRLTDLLEKDRARRALEPVIQVEDISVPEILTSVATNSGDGYLREADLSSLMGSVNADSFYTPQYDSFLATMIANILHAEAPIRDEVLIRKVARAHGFQRAGARIVEKVTAIAQLHHGTTTEDTGAFFWVNKSDIEFPVPFRKPTEDSSRTITEICLQELTSLARTALDQGLSGDGATTFMSRTIGVQKLHNTHRERLEQALMAAASTESGQAMEGCG